MHQRSRLLTTLTAVGAVGVLLAGCSSDAAKPSHDAVKAKLAAEPSVSQLPSAALDCVVDSTIKYSNTGSLNDYVAGKIKIDAVTGNESDKQKLTDEITTCVKNAIGSGASTAPSTGAATEAPSAPSSEAPSSEAPSSEAPSSAAPSGDASAAPSDSASAEPSASSTP